MLCCTHTTVAVRGRRFTYTVQGRPEPSSILEPAHLQSKVDIDMSSSAVHKSITTVQKTMPMGDLSYLMEGVGL